MHISWRDGGKQCGWVVQWRGKTWGGFHATQTLAAKTLKDAMGLSSLRELPSSKRSMAAQRRTVRFKGVYWHKGIQAYTTRNATGKTYKTAQAAAKATGAKKKGLKPDTILKRVQFIQRIYRGVLPADGADLVERAPVLRQLVVQEPALEPLICQLKYGPWRSAVTRAWLQQASVQSPVWESRTVQERAACLHTVLVTAVQEISEVGVSRLWGRNCGRGVGRHSGGAPVLRHLGVIVVARAGAHNMRFHDRASGELSDDSDDDDAHDPESKVQSQSLTAWKLGPAKRSHT